MLWLPPHNRTCSVSSLAAILCLSVLVVYGAGCASIEQLGTAVAVGHSAVAASETKPDALADPAGIPDVPEFDDLPAPPRVASSRPASTGITAPAPFAWDESGNSAGGRPFQTLSTGKDGYRTLVAGSVGGHDPLALELMEKLARYLHDNSLILGGFEARLIRTLNPDGAVNQRHVNQDGIYVNSQFPDPSGTATVGSESTAEVRFLLQQMAQFQPQRVIHVRSVQRQRGVVAAGGTAKSVADELARWLKFDSVVLGPKSGPGSLERFLAVRHETQIVTIGIPVNTDAETVWEQYGDALLNLLLSEDPATRDIARRQQQQNAAKRVSP